MFLFNIFSIFYLIFIPAYKKKKALMHLTWVSVLGISIVSNFDALRYAESKDKRGNKFIYDRITGEKWKSR